MQEEKRRKGAQDASVQSASRRQTRREDPTGSDGQLTRYQTVPDRRFPTQRAHDLIQKIVSERLEAVEYGRACAVISKELSDCVRKCVRKCVTYARYKLVCYVIIGELRNAVMNCASRAVWSPAADTCTHYIYKNKSLFAVCILYAIYKE